MVLALATGMHVPKGKVSQDALPANSNKANDAVADPNIIDRGVFCCRYCHEDDFDCQAYCDWNIC